MTRGSSERFNDGRSLLADLLGQVIHMERGRNGVRPGQELSLIALLARAGLLSPLVFRVWCYMRPFIA
jgi:hypothetical protein